MIELLLVKNKGLTIGLNVLMNWRSDKPRHYLQWVEVHGNYVIKVDFDAKALVSVKLSSVEGTQSWGIWIDLITRRWASITLT